MLLVPFLLCSIVAQAQEVDPPRPNVLFIAVDDLNDWVGCLGGNPEAKTPNLDALAAQGVLFTNAHCTAPVCNPSRVALMTGIRPSTSGVYDNGQPFRRSSVLQDAVTLPQYFMKHGYTALGSGKIYHGGHPDPASWDEYWPSQLINSPPDPKSKIKAPGGLGHFNWGPIAEAKEEMGDWQVTDWVSNQLAKEHEKPFFLACGIFRPHLPWHVPQKYFDLYPQDEIELPTVKENDLADIPSAGVAMAKPQGDHKRVTANNAWRAAIQGYLASITFADDCVGKVMGALDKSPHRDNTIVVLWSDHGWHLGEKEHWRKFSLWEEATRSVLMVIAPGVTKAGERCDSPVNLLDIYPTLNELCKLPKKEELEGVSFLSLLKDPASPWERPSLTTHGQNNHSLRSADWRYIQYADGSEELYDHRTDPMEWNNLATNLNHASEINEFKQWLPKTNAKRSPSGRK